MDSVPIKQRFGNKLGYIKLKLKLNHTNTRVCMSFPLFFMKLTFIEKKGGQASQPSFGITTAGAFRRVFS